MRLLKKVLKGILIVLLLVIGSVGLIFGKEYIESKRIERIVKSDEAKKAIESMLMDIDDKALTSEGVIKSKTMRIPFSTFFNNLILPLYYFTYNYNIILIFCIYFKYFTYKST